MLQHKARQLIFAGGSLVALSWADIALAQAATPASEVETLVVTARKREETLIEVPTAASAFGAAQLQAENIVNTREILNRTPGVTMIEFGKGGYSSEPILRGVGAGQSALNLSESATGLYRNDAYYAGGAIGGRAFTAMDYFDLAQLEVYRGPQGALFGRNAVGGAISLTSQVPLFETSGRVEASYGENERYGANAVFNLATSDQLAFRFGVMGWRQDESFVKGANGRPLEYDEGFGVRLATRWRGDAVRATAFLDLYDFDGPSLGKASGSLAFSNVAIPALANPFRKPPELNIDPRVHQQEVNGTLSVSYDAPYGTWTAISYGKRRDGKETNDYDWNLVTPTLARVIDPNIIDATRERFSAWSQEIRLVSPGEGRFDWLVGSVFLEQHNRLQRNIAGARIGGPGPATTRTLDDQISNDIDQDSRSISIYGQAAYDVTERLNLSAEARYTRDEKDFVGSTIRFNYVAGICCTPSTNTVDLEDSWTSLSGALVARLEVGPQRNVYARVARSYRPGGFNEDPGIAPGGGSAGFVVPSSYDQEKTIAYELGFKGQFLDQRLTLAASVTQTEVKGVLTPTLCINVGATPNPDCTRQVLFIFNSADTRNRSFESDLTYIQPDVFGGTATLRLGVAFNKSKYTAVNFLQPGLSTLPLLGGKAQWVRPEMVSAGLTYRRALWSGATGYANVVYAYQHGGVQNAGNTVFLTTLAQIDLNAGIESGPWAVRLNVKNATDQFRYTFLSGNTRQVNEPRTYQITATRRF